MPHASSAASSSLPPFVNSPGHLWAFTRGARLQTDSLTQEAAKAVHRRRMGLRGMIQIGC